LSNTITRENEESRSRKRAIRLVPHALDVRDPPEHEQDVDRAVAEHLMGNMHAIGGLRVLRLRRCHHRAIFVCRTATPQRATDCAGEEPMLGSESPRPARHTTERRVKHMATRQMVIVSRHASGPSSLI
jgi:hypothetical protein